MNGRFRFILVCLFVSMLIVVCGLDWFGWYEDIWCNCDSSIDGLAKKLIKMLIDLARWTECVSFTQRCSFQPLTRHSLHVSTLSLSFSVGYTAESLLNDRPKPIYFLRSFICRTFASSFSLSRPFILRLLRYTYLNFLIKISLLKLWTPMIRMNTKYNEKI